MLEDVKKRSQELGIALRFTDSAIGYIAKAGLDPHYGARPLRRAITQLVGNPLSLAILKGEIKEGDLVKVTQEKDEIVFSPQSNDENAIF